ncbi:MAG TPA: D-alanyl-D-alanine carboxypeptidase/D-alanyl-D-alanine-endopeptidase [Solirubrobacteraceae bacterium]|nr:D-alanyl-D-alanine carboxypeptidase/D-alanyl-D-alanine-endopeptidase [Solirubrobacteraceae bacterium]
MLAPACGRRLALRRLLAALLTACAALALDAAASHALGPDALRARLARDMRQASTFSGAYVRDLGTGDVLFARKDTVARVPASVQKLYTTSTALLRFGPEARLRTQVLAAGAVDELGVLRGNLYLRGGGDPTLGRAEISALAATFAAQSGIARVDGSVLGDETLFDSRRGAARTAFAFDRNIGGVLSGLAVGRGFSRDGAPAKEAARRFAKALRAAGVRVDGRSGAGVAPVEAREVAGVDSPPMTELARLTNVPSDNFDAEMLLKALGAAFGGAGTTPAGAAVVRSQLALFGIRPRVVDGSGLSRSNRTTPRQVVGLLAGMHAQEEVGHAFEASLAVAGRTGTVRRRMRGTAAQDRCRAKTGTLRAVSALAGYCLTTGGRTVAFAILMSTRNTARAHVVQDRMTAAIATYGS